MELLARLQFYYTAPAYLEQLSCLVYLYYSEMNSDTFLQAYINESGQTIRIVVS
jgi:hypothetical protein